MTVGYPDDQAFTNATGPPIADNPAFSLVTGSPFTAAGFITNFQSARVRVVPSGTTIGATCTISYFADATLADLLGTYTWIIAPTGGLAAIVPTLGPYVQITVSTVSAVANNTAIQLTPMTAPCASVRYLAVGNDAVALNVSIAASGNAVITTPFVAEGPGYWYFNPRDNAAKLNAVMWDLSENGSRVSQLDQVQGAVAATNRPLMGAPRLLQLQVTNTDAAAAHSFDARICIDGR